MRTLLALPRAAYLRESPASTLPCERASGRQWGCAECGTVGTIPERGKRRRLRGEFWRPYCWPLRFCRRRREPGNRARFRRSRPGGRAFGRGLLVRGIRLFDGRAEFEEVAGEEGLFNPSLDGGLLLFELFRPSRRSSSASLAFSNAFSCRGFSMTGSSVSTVRDYGG